jgi:hypothetical protein
MHPLLVKSGPFKSNRTIQKLWRGPAPVMAAESDQGSERAAISGV